MQLTSRQRAALQNTFLDYRSTDAFLQNPLVVSRAEGLYYWDTEGKRYFDAEIFVALKREKMIYDGKVALRLAIAMDSHPLVDSGEIVQHFVWPVRFFFEKAE